MNSYNLTVVLGRLVPASSLCMLSDLNGIGVVRAHGSPGTATTCKATVMELVCHFCIIVPLLHNFPQIWGQPNKTLAGKMAEKRKISHFNVRYKI